jgi:3-keto-5-aminohexanoate cleavage enzyme
LNHELESAIDPRFESKPMIITVAVTGAVPQKSKYPSLPTTPQEIADTALACASLGASTIHLHMRDSLDQQTQDPDQLLETIRLIRAGNKSVIICATTTSRGSTSLADRLTALQLPKSELPDMLSLTLGSYNTPTGVNLNPRSDIEFLASAMMDAGVVPELEIFEPGMIYTYLRMTRAGKISKPGIVNILLGVDGAAAANARELLHLTEMLPTDLEWAVAGIGSFQKRTVWLGAVLGGNVRVGMEDDPRGEFDGWTNENAVQRAVSAAGAVGRAVASPMEARFRMGLDADSAH